jgi:glycine dehydrogenase subunit 1
MFKYLPHTSEDIKEMLETIGVSSIDELFREVPKELMNPSYDVPSSHSELELRRRMNELAKKNKELIPFVGAGAYDHYTPSVIRPIIERQEFLTAYTPYQPEISQGTLQYIFEYQSIVAELTGMDVSNASMYDGATATAEAMFMAVAARKKPCVLVSRTMNPNIVNVLETYAKYRDIELVFIEEKDGLTDLEDLENKVSKEVAGVIVQSPNFYGIIEDFSSVKERIEDTKALFILNQDLASLSVLKTPGSIGVDIAVGEAQTLGLPLSYGGPFIGYLATTKKLMRKMPGRICGVTTDKDGKRAFVLTLQAREQHIRRDKANSNICSNQSLLALAVTVYTSIMGKQGLKEAQMNSYKATHYLADQVCKLEKFEQVYQADFFKDVLIQTNIEEQVIEDALLEAGILGPLAMVRFDQARKGQLLFSATEKRTKEEIDLLVQVLEAL